MASIADLSASVGAVVAMTFTFFFIWPGVTVVVVASGVPPPSVHERAGAIALGCATGQLRTGRMPGAVLVFVTVTRCVIDSR